MLHGKCSMYVDRPGFVEHALLAQSLERYGVSALLGLDQLREGSFFGAAEDLLRHHSKRILEGVQPPDFATVDGVQLMAEIACGLRAFSSLPAID